MMLLIVAGAFAGGGWHLDILSSEDLRTAVSSRREEMKARMTQGGARGGMGGMGPGGPRGGGPPGAPQGQVDMKRRLQIAEWLLVVESKVQLGGDPMGSIVAWTDGVAHDLESGRSLKIAPNTAAPCNRKLKVKAWFRAGEAIIRRSLCGVVTETWWTPSDTDVRTAIVTVDLGGGMPPVDLRRVYRREQEP